MDIKTDCIYRHTFNPNCTDEVSRQIIIDFMRSKGFYFDEGSKYGIDLVSDTVALELEHRRAWQGSQFPYSNYRMPARKAHLFNKPSTLKPYYLIINEDYTYAMMISQDKILPYLKPSNLTTVVCMNDYRDSFYPIPINQFTVFSLD